MNWQTLDSLLRRRPGNSLLGLALDGNRLEGVLLRRANGTVTVRKTFSVLLALEPLTAEVELAAGEIRRHLDAAQIRERWCAVALPLNWALSRTVELPPISEADVPEFLQIEAERGFPYGPEALLLAHSRFQPADAPAGATLVGIPREHIARLEAVLQAAQLRPVSFSLGLPALLNAEPAATDAVLALLPGESTVGLEISWGGGVALLRVLDGVFEPIGAERELQADRLVRELRITLGQLPPAARAAVRRLRVLGRGETAQELAEELRARAGALALRVEPVRDHPPLQYGLRLPPGTALSPAVAVALRWWAGAPGLEFLPPRVSPWKQFAARYSSGRLACAGAGAGALAVGVALAFLGQQIVLWHWAGQWRAMEQKVGELTAVRDQIRRYRPWFDDSMRTLSILKRLTEAFPQDGAVSAKTVEVRESARVTCSGTARNLPALSRTLDALRGAREVSAVHIETTRGNTPLEFTFHFQWGGPGNP